MDSDIKVGAEVFRRSSRFRIINLIDVEHLLIRNSATGKVEKAHISEISTNPNEGDAENFSVLTTQELLSIDDECWAEAHKKALLYSGVLQTEYIHRNKKLKEVSQKLGISTSSAYRQLQKFKENDGDPLCLLRKKRDDTYRFSSQTESLIQQAINGYLSREKKSVADVYRDLQLLVYKKRKENKAQGIDEEVEMPHINTLRFRISRLTAAEVDSKREGKKGKEKYRPILGQFPQLQKPLEIVQIDHTPLDVMVVDDENRLAIGRPIITLAIDVFSRMVVGFFITFESPSSLSVGCCLTHAILDKKAWLLEHGVEGEWPAYGLMDTIHTDNGKEFHGNMLKRACQKYKINLTKRPVGTPRYGPHVERAFKTYNEGGLHALPGSTKSNTQQRGEYKSEKEAVLTLKELQTWFTEYIVNVYHKELQSELGMSPLDKYKLGILGDANTLGRGLPPKVENELTLRIDFLPFEHRSVQKYGVKISGVNYFHDLLRKWMVQPDKTRKGSRRFIIRYDPRDMRKVYFYDPDIEGYIEVPYYNHGRPPVSLWQIAAYKKKAKELFPNRKIDEDAIFEARERMEKIVENAKKETKAIRLKKQKEKVRKNQSIPSINAAAKSKPVESAASKFEDDNDVNDFEDLTPFEELDQ